MSVRFALSFMDIICKFGLILPTKNAISVLGGQGRHSVLPGGRWHGVNHQTIQKEFQEVVQEVFQDVFQEIIQKVFQWAFQGISLRPEVFRILGFSR